MSSDQHQRQTGVDPLVRKQLAIDIEEAGGIQIFDKGNPRALDDILNISAKYNQETIGRGSAERRKIRNLVQQWKRYTREQCLARVLIPFVVQRSALARPSQEPSNNSTTNSDSDEADSEEEPPATSANTNQKISDTRKTSPLRKPSKLPSKTSNTAMTNELGSKLVVPIPTKGLNFVVYWVDSNLRNLEVTVSEDGFSVSLASKRPNPDGTADLLSHYPWASDADNVVASTVQKELEDLKKDPNDPDVWTKTVIVSLDEEVVRTFVDNKGNLTGDVGYNHGKDGRQIISFFLKTVEAHRTAPRKGKFTNNGNANPSGMDIGGEDNSSEVSGGFMSAEEAVEDVRAEFADRFNKLSHEAQKRDEELRGQMQQSAAQMNNMMNLLNNLMHHAQAQQPPQQQSGFHFNTSAASGNEAQPDNIGSEH